MLQGGLGGQEKLFELTSWGTSSPGSWEQMQRPEDQPILVPTRGPARRRPLLPQGPVLLPTARGTQVSCPYRGVPQGAHVCGGQPLQPPAGAGLLRLPPSSRLPAVPRGPALCPTAPQGKVISGAEAGVQGHGSQWLTLPSASRSTWWCCSLRCSCALRC